MSAYPRLYYELCGHMPYHNPRKWLLRGYEKSAWISSAAALKYWLLLGALHEGAVTIGEAILNIPDHRLMRRMARALARDVDRPDTIHETDVRFTSRRRMERVLARALSKDD